MPEQPVIDVADLCKTYREGLLRRRSVEALRGVTLAVPRGEIFGLLGPNGAGKTTLIKILLGIVKTSGGSARMFGRAAGARRARAMVGYLPEGHRLPRHLTGDTALSYYGGLSGMPAGEIRRRRGRLLEMVGLEKWGKTSVRKYSKGMLQRLGIAQAMLHDPELLILDEPTDGVDPVGRTEIRDVLKRLKDENKTVFLNSHLLQETELICDRVAVLVEGRVRRLGAVEELTSRTDAEVLLQLGGEEASIREALKGFEIASSRAAAGGVEIALRVADQAGLDRCVDSLRGRGVSIVSLTRRRISLEEAFMELVREREEPADAIIDAAPAETENS